MQRAVLWLNFCDLDMLEMELVALEVVAIASHLTSLIVASISFSARSQIHF